MYPTEIRFDEPGRRLPIGAEENRYTKIDRDGCDGPQQRIRVGAPAIVPAENIHEVALHDHGGRAVSTQAAQLSVET
jgi:hypothetical protein